MPNRIIQISRRDYRLFFIGIIHMVTLFILSFVALAVRWPLSWATTLAYSSDTAILTLMARHFLKGEFSFYYWRAGYYGVLDPILLMGIFKVFGATPATTQLLPLFLTPVYLLLFYIYLNQISDSWTAIWGTLFLAIPCPYMLFVQFGTYNYFFGPVLGLLNLILAEKILARPDERRWSWAFGLAAGFSWYYFRMISFFWGAIGLRFLFHFYGRKPWDIFLKIKSSLSWKMFYTKVIKLQDWALPSGLKSFLVFMNKLNLGNLIFAALLWMHGDWESSFHGHRVRISFWDTFRLSLQVGAATAFIVYWKAIYRGVPRLWKWPNGRAIICGFLIGYSPALIGSLLGAPPNSPSQFVSLPVFWNNARLLIMEMVPMMFSTQGAAWQVIAYDLLIGFCACVLMQELWGFFQNLRSSRRIENVPHALVFLFAINLFLGLWGTQHPDRWTARYYEPLYLCLALGFARIVQWAAKKNYLLAATFLVFVLWQQGQSTWRQVRSATRPDPYEIAAHRLEELHCRGGYADYWIAYRLTAFAQEQIIIVPTGDNDRYRPYLDYVRSLSHVVWLGQSLPSDQQQVSIKGLSYKVTSQTTIAGLPAVFLDKL